MQFPPAAPSARGIGDVAVLVRAAQRRPLARDIPQLRDPLFHRHIDVHRVTPGLAGPHPGICRGSGQAVRECLRAGPHLQL